jgi:cytochrome c biogenesis protein CcmG/thiol:disulfide interchange protein DsbE
MMKRMKWTLLGSLATVAALVAPAAAQQSDDAKASLAESTQVLRNTESLQFKSKRYATGVLKDIIDSEGEVWIFRPKGQQAVTYKVSGRVKQPGMADKKLMLVNDGTVIRWLDYDKNTMFVRAVGDKQATQEMNYANQLFLNELIQPEPFNKDLKAEKLTKTGVEQVMNEVCEIISAGPKTDDRATIWAISQVDRLPRRMEMAQGTGEAKIAMILDMWDVKTDGKFTAKDFEITMPAGFVLDEKIAAKAPVVPPANAPVVELGLPAGTPAPAFTLTGSDGKDVSLASMKGSPVVLEFFGTVVKASTAHGADMKALHDAFKGQNVKFVGLACRESDPAAAKAYFQTNGLEYTLVPNGDAAVADYKVLGFPSYCVIDANGNVTAFFQGWPGKEKLSEAVTKAASTK